MRFVLFSVTMSAGVSVIIEDLKKHPRCPHGPTLLFKTLDNNKPRNFFACSACRDRKLCSIFVWQDELQTYRKKYWENKIVKLVAKVNPQNLYITFMNVLQMCEAERMYCYDCGEFEIAKYQAGHLKHNHKMGISEHLLRHPSVFLEPMEDSKKEAQYLFNETSCKFIVDSIMKLGYKYVLCIGTPRIHEYIVNNCVMKLDSLLMDFDKRYLSFYNPLQFLWYNMFNHHFFLESSRGHYEDFLSNNKSNELIIITDPPFGGRIEPLAETISLINQDHQVITKLDMKLPTYFIFPYFMEPQITNAFDDFTMLDYKVDYDNHPLFSQGPKARKQGSPVRIFTNLKHPIIELPESEGYKFCNKCKRWVSEENQHCDICKSCTSKDGRTYVHCEECNRCVKPTWTHCNECNKCSVVGHKCAEIKFTNECFHCKEAGHKKSECPLINDIKSPKRKLKDTADGQSDIQKPTRELKKSKTAPTINKKRNKQKKK